MPQAAQRQATRSSSSAGPRNRSATAQSASEGVVGYADLSTRPISRAAELVEVIPGMIATEHSSGGKANQYFLRGFNLDHGTDFAGFIDGVPINQRSHPHMSGYLDLNFLMADLVERVEFKKGVQYAENGDYSSAGSASFVLYDKLPENYVQLRVDPDEYRRQRRRLVGHRRRHAAGRRQATKAATARSTCPPNSTRTWST